MFWSHRRKNRARVSPRKTNRPNRHLLTVEELEARVLLDATPPTVTLSVLNPNAAEAGPTPGTFLVLRSGDTTNPLTVNYTVAGTATPGSDYLALPSSVTIPAHAAATLLTVLPIPNPQVEGDESVIVTLGNSADYTLGKPSSGTITIAEAPQPTVTLLAGQPNAAESGPQGPVPGSFTVARSGSTALPLTVTYSVSGTATAGTDYAALPGTVTIPAGATQATIPVTPSGTPAVTADETVIAALANSSSYALGTSTKASVTIVAAPLPAVTLVASQPDADPWESGGPTPGTFTVTRKGDTALPLTVQYTVNGTATPGTDYTALPGSVTIPAGSTTAIITVSPLASAPGTTAETVDATLSVSPTYTVGALQSDLVIIPAAPSPTVTLVATQPNATESGENGPVAGAFTVSRTGSTASDLTVDYTVAGTASAGTAYTALPGTITIPAGAASAAITVTPTGTSLGGQTETVVTTLATEPTYTLGSQSSDTVTLTDGTQPTVTITATQPAAAEGVAGVVDGVFTVTRTGPTSQALLVNYTVSGTAVAGTDYDPLPGTLTFDAGTSTATLTVHPRANNGNGSPTVVVTLASGLSGLGMGMMGMSGMGTSGTSAYTVGQAGSATVTITEQTLPAVSIQATDPNAAESSDEGPVPGTFTFTRTGDTSQPLTVHYTVSGSATPDSDYAALPSTLLIPAGAASAALPVTPLGTTGGQGNETVVVTLASDPAYALGMGTSATVTITPAPLPVVTLVASQPSASEAGGDNGQPEPGTFLVSRTGDSSQPLTIHYTVGGTATPGTDYAPLSGTLTLDAGDSSNILSIDPVAYHLQPANENVVVSLAADNAYILGGPSSDTVTIAATPLPAVSISADQADAAVADDVTGDPDPGLFTISRTGSTDSPLTVTYTIGGSAVPGTDYTALSGSVTIPEGDDSASIEIDPLLDNQVAGNPAVTLTVTTSSAYTVAGPTTATVTITEPPPPTVSIQATDPEAAAAGTWTAASPGTFTVTRTGSTNADLVVGYTVSGNAVAGTDYAALSGSVTIPAGSTTATLEIDPLSNTQAQPDETVTVTLNSSSAYTVDSANNDTVHIRTANTATQLPATDPSSALAASLQSGSPATGGFAALLAPTVAAGQGGTSTGNTPPANVTTCTTDLGVSQSAHLHQSGNALAGRWTLDETFSYTYSTNQVGATLLGPLQYASSVAHSYTLHEEGDYALGLVSLVSYSFDESGTPSLLTGAAPLDLNFAWANGSPPLGGTFTLDQDSSSYTSYHIAGSTTGGTYHLSQGSASSFAYTASGDFTVRNGLTTYQHGTQTLDEGLNYSFDYSEDGTFTNGSDANGATVNATGTFSLNQQSGDHYHFAALGTYLNLTLSSTDSGTFTQDQAGSDHANVSAAGTFTSGRTSTGSTSSATGTFTADQGSNLDYDYSAVATYSYRDRDSGSTNNSTYTRDLGDSEHVSYVANGNYTSTGNSASSTANYTADQGSAPHSSYSATGTYNTLDPSTGSSDTGNYTLSQGNSSHADYTENGTATQDSSGAVTRTGTFTVDQGNSPEYSYSATGSYTRPDPSTGSSDSASYTQDQGNSADTTYTAQGSFSSTPGSGGSTGTPTVSSSGTETQTQDNAAHNNSTSSGNYVTVSSSRGGRESGAYTRADTSSGYTFYQSSDTFTRNTAGGGSSTSAGSYSTSQGADSGSVYNATGSYNYGGSTFSDNGTFRRSQSSDNHASTTTNAQFNSSDGGSSGSNFASSGTTTFDQGSSSGSGYHANGVYTTSDSYGSHSLALYNSAEDNSSHDHYGTAGNFTLSASASSSSAQSNGTFASDGASDQSSSYTTAGSSTTFDANGSRDSVTYTRDQGNSSHSDYGSTGTTRSNADNQGSSTTNSGISVQDQSSDAHLQYHASGDFDRQPPGRHDVGTFLQDQGWLYHAATTENASFTAGSSSTAGDSSSVTGTNTSDQVSAGHYQYNAAGVLTVFASSGSGSDTSNYTRDEGNNNHSTYHSGGNFSRSTGASGPADSSDGTFNLDQGNDSHLDYAATGSYTFSSLMGGSSAGYSMTQGNSSHSSYAIPGGTYRSSRGASGNSNRASGAFTLAQGNSDYATSATVGSSSGTDINGNSTSGTFQRGQSSSNTYELREWGTATRTGSASSLDGNYSSDRGNDSGSQDHETSSGASGSGSSDSNAASHYAGHEDGTLTQGNRRQRSFLVDSTSSSSASSHDQHSDTNGSYTADHGSSQYANLHETGTVLHPGRDGYNFSRYTYDSGTTSRDAYHGSGSNGMMTGSTGGSSGTLTYSTDSSSTAAHTVHQTGLGSTGSYSQEDSGTSSYHEHTSGPSGDWDYTTPTNVWHNRYVGSLDLSHGTAVVTTSFGGSVGPGWWGQAWWAVSAATQAGMQEVSDAATAAGQWLQKDWSEQVLDVLNWATDGQASNVLLSQTFTTVLNTTDGFIAGFDDALTAGLSTRARTWLWGDLATQNHQGTAFTVGQVAGTIYGIGLSFADPCEIGGVIGLGVRGLNAVRGVGSAINAYENYSKGNYLSGTLDAVSAAGDLASVLKACFAAGTPLLTPTGSKLIEQFRPGDLVLSRPEGDVGAAVEAKVVEEVFVRTGRIMHLHIGGQVIRTTSEHPFYVAGKGWVAGGGLQVGDWLSSHDGQWVAVEDLLDTGEYETVYNLRVAEHHTYFVGNHAWLFSVWAHNAGYEALGLTKKQTQTAIKTLTQYERLAQKFGVNLSPRRIAELNALRDAGTITSGHLPGTLLRKFPGQLAGRRLADIVALLK